MRRTAVITVLALVACVVQTAASASASPYDSLQGSCKLSGQLDFDQPVGNLPAQTGFVDHASGTCTGTLNGVPAENLPVELRATGSGSIGCLEAHTTSAGTVTLTMATGRQAKIGFWTDVTGALTQLVGRFGGSTSGEGVAYVNVLPYTDQAVSAACQAGTLTSVRYDLITETVTPMVG
jgi:hypothetical protein